MKFAYIGSVSASGSNTQSPITGVVPIPEIATPVLALTDLDITEDSFYYFTPYLATDFPMITGITKKYFFVWSGDHSVPLTDVTGCYWGEGDNLDLSDFAEIGKCFDNTNPLIGQHNETPQLYNIDGVCFFYFHGFAGVPQLTKLFTGGGSLTDIDSGVGWTWQGYPLNPLLTGGTAINGIDEDRNSYFTVNKLLDNTYKGAHTVASGLIRWSSSIDGITWVREATEGEPETYERLYKDDLWVAALGSIVFKFGSNIFYFPLSESINQPNSQVISAVKVDDDYLNPVMIKELKPIEGFLGSLSPFLDKETNTMHLYYTNKNIDLYHTTLDVSNAYRWDLVDREPPFYPLLTSVTNIGLLMEIILNFKTGDKITSIKSLTYNIYNNGILFASYGSEITDPNINISGTITTISNIPVTSGNYRITMTTLDGTGNETALSNYIDITI